MKGKQGHVGYPHLADNPIRGIVRLLAALDALRRSMARQLDRWRQNGSDPWGRRPRGWQDPEGQETEPQETLRRQTGRQQTE